MGFWNVNLEAAQAQASQAGPWAKRWLQTVTEQTMHLAEQASSKLPPALHTPYDADSPPSPAELTEYGITPDFKEFVRSLTYSTFRDFHGDETAAASASASTPQSERLTPWQEKHALLVVHSVQEINELRFVLVPKRMTDQDFWRIYFTLARKYLPACAFDISNTADKASSSQAASTLAGFDLQDRFQQLSVSAKQWGAQATASLQAATASGQRQGLLPQTLWQKLSPAQQTHASAQKAAADLADLAHRPADTPPSPSADLPVSTGPHAPETELAEDPDLEAYLRDVGNDEADEESSSSVKAAVAPANHAEPLDGDEDGDIDEDFERYISELNDEQDNDAASEVQADSKEKKGTSTSK